MWIPYYVIFFFTTFALVNLFPGAMMISLQSTVRKEEYDKKRQEDAALDTDAEQGGAPVRTDFELLLETFAVAHEQDVKHVQDFLAGKEHFTESVEVPKEPRCTPKCHPLVSDLRDMVTAPWGYFSYFIYFIIAACILTLAIDGYNSDEQTKQACAALNIIYVAIFIGEFLIKLLLLGPYGYFGDTYNLLDFTLAILGVLDLIVSSAFAGTKALRVVRIFRLARVVRLASLSKVVRLTKPTPSIDILRMLEIFSEAGYFVSVLYFLLLFFNFIFALAGMQLFGGFSVIGTKARFNFDSFNNAFMSVFSMTTGSTGYNIFKKVAFTQNSNLVFLFYIIWQILSKYFLLATVSATIFQRVNLFLSR
jgi:hypothetical protein